MKKPTRQEINALILSWCSYQQGGRITNLKPDGAESHGDGDEWNEEQWCYDRVEAAIVLYIKAYDNLDKSYSVRAQKQIRAWLMEIFWDSCGFDKFGDWAAMVAMEVHRFKALIAKELEKDPKPLKLPTAQYVDPHANAVLNEDYLKNRQKMA